MADKKNTILTRFIGNKKLLDKTGFPMQVIFIKRKDEEGLSTWDISNFIDKKDELKIYELGDKEYAKKPPYTIGRCDLKKGDIDSLFEKIGSKFPNINYNIITRNLLKWRHKEICFNTSDNPALAYHIAQELLNIAIYKKRPKL